LLPLMAACVASYLVSYLLMKNTIMTEKIARRGVNTPHVYEPDILNNFKVKHVLTNEAVVIGQNVTLAEIRVWLQKRKIQQQNFYVVADVEGTFKGIVSATHIFNLNHDANKNIEAFIEKKTFPIKAEENLKKAVEIMASENLDVLPVIGNNNNKITGVLSYKDIIAIYKRNLEEHQENRTISLKRRTLQVLLHGRKKLSKLRND
jgi:chloride channel protein, CIC family